MTLSKVLSKLQLDPPSNAEDIRDAGLIPVLGRSPGEGNGNPPQYFCLENSMDRGGWQAAVPGVAHSWTRLKRLSTPICTTVLQNQYNNQDALLFNIFCLKIETLLKKVGTNVGTEVTKGTWDKRLYLCGNDRDKKYGGEGHDGSPQTSDIILMQKCHFQWISTTTPNNQFRKITLQLLFLIPLKGKEKDKETHSTFQQKVEVEDNPVSFRVGG